MTRKLPENLRAAYNWTEAAGELDELRDLDGEALDTYCRESAENARENDTHDVTATDLALLHEWLRDGDQTTATARHAEAIRRLLDAGETEKAVEVARAHHTRKLWVADDGNAELEYDAADYDRAEAAQEYVDGGDWNYDNEPVTSWVTVYVFPRYYVGDLAVDDKDGSERSQHTCALLPEEPVCSGDEHDWRSPHAIVGGIKENPGVRGNAGGVIVDECCVHCGCQRQTDTWAQNPTTGEQGLTSVRYRPGHYADALEALRDNNADD